MLVEVAEILCDLGIGVEALKRLMRLKIEELGKFIQGGAAPLASLLYFEDLHGTKYDGDVVGAERAYEAGASAKP